MGLQNPCQVSNWAASVWLHAEVLKLLEVRRLTHSLIQLHRAASSCINLRELVERLVSHREKPEDATQGH